MEENIDIKKFLLNLVINIVIPIAILLKFSSYLGPINAFIVALIFPLGYGLYDFFKDRKVNFYSLIGIFGILVTVGIGFLKLDPELIAIKEALIPLAIGIGILVLEKGNKFVRKFLDKMLDMKKIQSVLKRKDKTKEFDRLLNKTTYIFVSGFFASSIVNYLIAKAVVVSQPGTATFNEQYALLTLLNFPALIIPIVASLFLSLYYLNKNIERITGIEIDKFYR